MLSSVLSKKLKRNYRYVITTVKKDNANYQDLRKTTKACFISSSVAKLS